MEGGNGTDGVEYIPDGFIVNRVRPDPLQLEGQVERVTVMSSLL